MGWSESHFWLIALIISLLVVYILSFYLFSLSLHFPFILSYRPRSAFFTLVLLFVFFFSLTVLSVSAPFLCSLILPDSVAFIFMIILQHHWTAKSLLLPFLFLLPLFPSLCFLLLLYLFSSWLYFGFVIKCNFQASKFGGWRKKNFFFKYTIIVGTMRSLLVKLSEPLYHNSST